jgi:hypothetical protein
MITNKGRDIIAKYLIGQAPAYASHIALGCGAKPLNLSEAYEPYLSEYAAKTEMDFEMIRTPITSRGYVTDLVFNDLSGQYEEVSKVVFTAELPTEQRYAITEIGVFSAKSNPSATGRDSRILYTFTDLENWEFHDKTTSVGLGATIASPLYGDSNDGNLNVAPYTLIDPNAADTEPNRRYTAFRTTTDNVMFDSPTRLPRYERCRYLDTMIMVPGDMSFIDKNSNNELFIKTEDADGYYGTHIHLAGTSVPLAENAPSDKLKLAFSIVNKSIDTIAQPTAVRLVVQFSADDLDISTNYASMNIELVDGENGVDFATNRYHVVTQQLEDLLKSATFSWSAVRLVKVYATVLSGSSPTHDYYVALDGLRFENTTSENPLYGISGYSAVRTKDAVTIVKDANSSSLVEFRFGLDVA